MTIDDAALLVDSPTRDRGEPVMIVVTRLDDEQVSTLVIRFKRLNHLIF